MNILTGPGIEHCGSQGQKAYRVSSWLVQSFACVAAAASSRMERSRHGTADTTLVYICCGQNLTRRHQHVLMKVARGGINIVMPAGASVGAVSAGDESSSDYLEMMTLQRWTSDKGVRLIQTLPKFGVTPDGTRESGVLISCLCSLWDTNK